uniref:Uncharacterized protein n=1 Tax=Arundo donax TaxID=35708 RepID=A0A0A8Z0W5_ARUDO
MLTEQIHQIGPMFHQTSHSFCLYFFSTSSQIARFAILHHRMQREPISQVTINQI